ncbi:hypothetical protein GF386_01650 [Candidatus Pacearchaeota archaeon]|nr:hypothetical protein [Candidatus Pacearchaeota archaeon]MBD3282884.1 hypothetical protein [Candidatus Pacearchaeota archaeon]
MKRPENKEEVVQNLIVILLIIGIILLFSLASINAVPQGPDSINVTANETKSDVSGKEINISGGYIATLNLSTTTKNTHWKAFVGWINGQFALTDQTGSTIFDWGFTSASGRVFATKNSTTPTWTNINCSNITHLNNENTYFNHTSPNDNLTVTFNATFNESNNETESGAHESFYVGTISITANSCPTTNTYTNNQSDQNYWEEVALYDGSDIIYAALSEEGEVGFDGNTYDFQMIVPEDATPGSDTRTAYYLYIELD